MKIKQHIINDKTNYCCGLKINKHKPTAFYDNGILYNFDGEQVTFNNMNEICTNCLKYSDDKYYNALLNEKRSFEYKNSIPKQSIFKKRWNINKRKNIAKRINKPYIDKSNIIYLPYTPIAITDTNRLIEYKPIIKSDNIDNNINPDTIITLTDEIKMDDEISFIEFSDGIAIIRGFGNQWQVILKSDNNVTESLTDWISYDHAIKEVNGLLAA